MVQAGRDEALATRLVYIRMDLLRPRNLLTITNFMRC